MTRKRKAATPRDNIRTVTIGDMDIDLEASLGTSIVYANEFRGRLEDPYRGVFSDDLLTIWRLNKPTVEMTVRVGEDGEIVFGDDGSPIEDADGESREVPNSEYRGIDVEALLRVAWAMARSVDPKAGRPFDGSHEEFLAAIVHQPAGVFEEASLYSAVVMDLGGGIIFRRPKGLGGAGEADETKEG